MRLFIVMAALLALSSSDIMAQTAPVPFLERWQYVQPGAPGLEPTQKQSPQQPAAVKDAAPQQPPVSVQQALYLIRSTLLTLNDANRSGNYTVLRDLAAPGFQAKHTAADLAQIFFDLRRRNFDLFAAAIIAPQLTSPPALDESGMLRLSGAFPTRPQQIKFELMFQSAGGQWRLFGISVATPEAPPPAQAQQHSRPDDGATGRK